jgi:hypothetical protein
MSSRFVLPLTKTDDGFFWACFYREDIHVLIRLEADERHFRQLQLASKHVDHAGERVVVGQHLRSGLPDPS